MYLATMSMSHHLTVDEMQDVDPTRNDGLRDIQLAVSRDGVTWTRPDRRPCVGLDVEGPGQRVVYAAQGLVRRGDRVLQYHTAFDHSHGHWPANNPGGVIRWTEQRLDGFVAAEFPYTGGELVTRPLTFTGDRLELNVDASASGEGRVELQDAQGRPVPGHSLADSDRVLGNHLRRICTLRSRRRSRLKAAAYSTSISLPQDGYCPLHSNALGRASCFSGSGEGVILFLARMDLLVRGHRHFGTTFEA